MTPPLVELLAPGWHIDGMRISIPRLRERYRLPTTATNRPGVQREGAPEDALGLGIPFLEFRRTDRRTEDGFPVYELERGPGIIK